MEIENHTSNEAKHVLDIAFFEARRKRALELCSNSEQHLSEISSLLVNWL